MSLDYELGYFFEPKSAPANWNPESSRPLATIWRFSGREAMSADAADAWLAAQGFPQQVRRAWLPWRRSFEIGLELT